MGYYCRPNHLDIVSMEFAPITRVEVKCSFSRYKSVLRPNSKAFNFDDFSMSMVSQSSYRIRTN